MNITQNDCLRSLCNEAGRQSDYYHRRGQDNLCQMWSELESLAHSAATQRQQLTLSIATRHCPCQCFNCRSATGTPQDRHCGGLHCLNSTKGDLESPIPIKHCENDQQQRNLNVIKALQ